MSYNVIMKERVIRSVVLNPSRHHLPGALSTSGTVVMSRRKSPLFNSLFMKAIPECIFYILIVTVKP